MLTFFHINVGSGLPLGGPHSSNAVSPAATRVSFGSVRKSSRKTVKKTEKNVKIAVKFQITKRKQRKKYIEKLICAQSALFRRKKNVYLEKIKTLEERRS